MDQKKLEIIERSSFVYMKYGIRSVTMDDLATHLGVSKKTIYKYFTDKNELIKTILDRTLKFEENICAKIQKKSENAIESIIQISKLVIDRLNNINPSIFYDLQKHHGEIWQTLENHKWNFVYNAITQNIQRGINENLYRKDIEVETIAKLYIANTDLLTNTDTFNWTEFKFHEVYNEVMKFQLNGLVNENGRAYLKQNFNNEYDV